MKNLQNLIFQVGGVLMVVGAAFPLFGLNEYAPAIFTVGALMFCPLQIFAHNEGTDARSRRLIRQQKIGAVLLIVAASLMWAHALGMGHIGSGEWKIALAIGTVFEIYPAFRL